MVKKMRVSFWIVLCILQAESIAITSSNDSIAFTVRQDSILISNTSTTVPFPDTLTNVGNAGLNAGVFTCTKSGLYEFDMHAMSDQGNTSFLDLYLDDQIVVSLRDYDLSEKSVSGNTAILSLEQGNTVQVKTRDQVEVYVGVGEAPQYYTTFTGVYLGSPDDTNAQEALFVALNNSFDVTTNGNINYKKVVVDTANKYDALQGVYGVPSDGIYIVRLFSLSDTIYFGQSVYHKGTAVLSVWNNCRSQASNTAILQMKKDDSLSVRIDYYYSTGFLKGSLTEIYSTFTVQKLFDGEPNNNASFVAFSVGFGEFSELANEKVVFDTVFYNLNNAYNLTTGEFVASVPGLYQFNIHAATTTMDPTVKGNFTLILRHNEKNISSTLVKDGNSYSASTQMLQIEAYDVVYLWAEGRGYVRGLGKFCTFTGHLVRAF